MLRPTLFGLLFWIVSACGFAPAVTWSKLDGAVSVLSDEPYSPVERELNQLIQQSLSEHDSLPVQNDVRRIHLLPLSSRTEVLSVDSNGRPAEYRLQLTQDVEFTIADTEYREQFSQHRDYVFDVRDILAYQEQAEQLKQTMSSRIARDILYAFSARLQAGEVN